MSRDRHPWPAVGLRLTAIAVVLAASFRVSAQAPGDESPDVLPNEESVDLYLDDAYLDDPYLDDASAASEPLFAEPDNIPVEPLRTAADSAPVDMVQVTGSRIRRPDLEGPLPITLVSKDDIIAAGDVSVGDFLARQSFNSFGGFTASSGFGGGAQGQAELSLRGLTSARTLVLMDGRRLPNTPAFAGAAQNLNALPLAIVERIEVLREGASAVYGSDAIGGVINIITRKDFEGVEASAQIERPTQPGADAAFASAVMGVSSNKGNLVISVDHFQRDILYRRDRDYLYAQEPSPLGGPGSFYRVDDRSDVFSVRPSPNISGAIIEPFSSCPDDFGGEAFPSSARANFPLFADNDTLCLYRFTDVAGQTASITRDTIFTSGNYDFTPTLTGFTRLSATRATSFGRFAAAPVTPVFGGLTMDATNPFNPTRNEVGGPSDIVLLFRPVANGPRDSEVTDTVTQMVFGLSGELDVAGLSGWEVAVFDNRYVQNETGLNYGLRTRLQELVDAGQYNPFDPDPEVGRQFAHTIATSNLYNARGIDGRLDFDDIEIRGYRFPLVVGGEYREEKYRSVVDQQSEAGDVFGSAGGTAGGTRDYFAFFAETGTTLFDDRLELGLALRHDDYGDIGSELSPKVSAGFRARGDLLLRGSYSEGFRAPDLEVLNRQPSQGFPSTIDRLGCELDPNNVNACSSRQRETSSISNPDLKPEQSENYNFGLVFTPMRELSVSLDYYNIRVTDGIGNLTAQNVLDNEQTCFNEGRTCNPAQEGQVIRSAPAEQGGQVVLIIAPAANFAVIKTDGLDLSAEYSLDTDLGRFAVDGQLSYVLNYDRATSPGAPLEETTRAVSTPKWRSVARAQWYWDSFTSALVLNHIPSTKDCTVRELNTGSENCGRKVASFTTFDLQAGWNTPWGGELVVGARNLFDKDPPLAITNGTAVAPETDQDLYSIFGRVPYVRYTHSF